MMFNAIGRWWRRRQRQTDIDILWPACKAQAPDSLYLAKSAFRLHCMLDPAWTTDLDLIQIEQIVEGLS